ncbi:MAG: YeeE/YedE family protein [Firmicutes bacterium]|nr:YeeE/YedE family protein [Bacillota bacterium]
MAEILQRQTQKPLPKKINLKVIFLFSFAFLGAWLLWFFYQRAFYPYLFGLFFGYIMQRSRFCFAAAFRDIFLIRNTALTRAVLVALFLTTVGFSVLHFALGINLTVVGRIYPAGLHTILGGLLFGFGMTVAGACVSGALVRMGEGNVMQYVTFLGLLCGSLWGAWHLNWVVPFSIAKTPTIFLPEQLGWPAALSLQLGCFVLFYFWALKVEKTKHVFSIFKKISAAMPYGRAAVYLAVGNTLFVIFYGKPWGITTGITSLAGWVAGKLGIAVNDWLYFQENFWLADDGGALIAHPLILLALGMLLGAMLASLYHHEFRWRFPRTNRYYWAALLGGICMGYGSRLAMGCNIGALLSGISSLSLHGWLFAAALFPGAYLGGKVLMRYLLTAN